MPTAKLLANWSTEKSFFLGALLKVSLPSQLNENQFKLVETGDDITRFRSQLSA
jgi:hypothetical protein